eukprot:TRINITY_DN7370_c1_g2_i2.p1 TRINITY_DN7370_c1_g2~~TRINITY_DN7370_c1_g2_i2.p1  ORF type:complete len:856 (+),score=195.15 TRINITY_DN7370_c1_g2_i2:82-2649(+)
MALATCGCGTQSALPKKIRRDALEELTARTKLKAPEVKALYARFRRLCPNGTMLPEQFKQTMGIIGLTEDSFLPDRMFQVFDQDGDGKLSFFEFASSLAVMIRGTEEEKLELSFHIASGGGEGIAFEDFQKLIRACHTIRQSVMAGVRMSTSDEDIERLFNELSSDDCEFPEAPSKITLADYQTAAQVNEEFLHFLGLETVGTNRRTAASGTDSYCADAFNRSRSRLNEFGSIHSSRALNADTAAQPAGVTVTPPQLEDLRERLTGLRQSVKRLQNRATVLPPQALMDTNGHCEGGSRPSRENSRSPPARSEGTEEEEPDERWWTPLAEKKKGSKAPVRFQQEDDADGGDVCGGTLFKEVQKELENVLFWCTEQEGRINGAADEPPHGLEKRQTTMSCASMPQHLSVARSPNGGDMDEKVRRTNVHRPTTMSMASQGGRHVARGAVVHNMSMAGRRRKRHRLLGPKKGLAVHFGHENWNMVLSMMIGIRMSVGRAKHEVIRDVQPVDFIMKEKFSIIPRLANVFDSTVSKSVTMTRFIDYAPFVFRRIRASFGINDDDYLCSVGPDSLLGNLVLGNLASLSELSSEGKSGAFFYYTADGNYMMKTVAPKEQKLLKGILQRYYEHISRHPNTLLVRFLGLHCLRVQGKHRQRKLYFVVMGNMFNIPLEIHRRFDLKGSWVGRETPEDEGRDPTVALKDVDFTKQNESIRIGPERKKLMIEQLERDVDFLAQSNIIDYSLLLGIHDIDEKTKTAVGLDDITLDEAEKKEPTSPKPSQLSDAMPSTIPVHVRDAGGMLSSDRKQLYFLGVIDILTPYDSFKVVEHNFKALRHNWRGVSCCPPPYYGQRFMDFMRKAIS